MIRFLYHSLLLCFGVLLPQWLFAQSYNESNLNNVQQHSNTVQTNSFNQVNATSRSVLSVAEYESQRVSLKLQVVLTPLNAKAWEDYYKAERYSAYTPTSKKISGEKQQELDQIVEEMEKHVAGTYEYHFVRYLNGNRNTELFAELQKAYALNPKSPEVIDELVIYYELTGNKEQKQLFCRKMKEHNEFPKEVMEYSSNLLRSLEANALLFTHGETDTYPSWIWQDVNKVRPDVKILYLDLLEKEEYRTRVLKELGIQVEASIEVNRAAFMNELAEKVKRPVYFSATLAPDLLAPVKDKLYPTGLAMRYSIGDYNNVDALKYNWEKTFNRKNLLKKMPFGSLQARMNLNYIPGLLVLAESYRNSGENDKAKLAEELALKLAGEAGKEQQVRSYLKKKP